MYPVILVLTEKTRKERCGGGLPEQECAVKRGESQHSESSAGCKIRVTSFGAESRVTLSLSSHRCRDIPRRAI